MSKEQYRFWPEDIAGAIPKMPVAILRMAGAELSSKTNGALEGIVDTLEDDSQSPRATGTHRHTLSIEAPGLDRYTVGILSISHDAELPYPCFVEPSEIAGQDENPMESDAWEVSDEPHLVTSIHNILQRPRVRSIIYSLLARLNEVHAVGSD